jgi:hypothetical protein
MMAALITKVAHRKRQPYISSGRRPIESMVKIQTVVPRNAMIALTDWNRRASPVDIPIWAKICGEKYLKQAYNNQQTSRVGGFRGSVFLLDRAHSGHLTTSLYRHDKDCPSEVWPPAEEIKVCDLLMRMLLCDLSLDEVELCKHIWVIRIAMCVQTSERLETFIGPVVVT